MNKFCQSNKSKSDQIGHPTIIELEECCPCKTTHCNIYQYLLKLVDIIVQFAKIMIESVAVFVSKIKTKRGCSFIKMGFNLEWRKFLPKVLQWITSAPSVICSKSLAAPLRFSFRHGAYVHSRNVSYVQQGRFLHHLYLTSYHTLPGYIIQLNRAVWRVAADETKLH